MSDGCDGADPQVPSMVHQPVVACAALTRIESHQPRVLDARGLRIITQSLRSLHCLRNEWWQRVVSAKGVAPMTQGEGSRRANIGRAIVGGGLQNSTYNKHI